MAGHRLHGRGPRRAALARRHLTEETALPLDRQRTAVRFIPRRQNDDGGFGSYEPRRGSMVLHHFNPAEIYGNCMLEYSYIECTASCVRGLAVARRHMGAALGDVLAGQVDDAVQGRRVPARGPAQERRVVRLLGGSTSPTGPSSRSRRCSPPA